MGLSSSFNYASLVIREHLSTVIPTGMVMRKPSKLDRYGAPLLPKRPITKTEFSQTQPFYNNGKNALIWAYIGTDTATRGDTHGSIGIARRVAEKLNGRVMVVDRAMLDSNFENLPHVEQLLQLSAREGYPDLILGTTSNSINKDILSRVTLRLTQFNEDFRASSALGISGLVPHHLTPAMLEEEGQKFDKHYPHLKKATLLSLFCAGLRRMDLERMAKKIARVMAHEKEGTIFVCPCHRTDEDNRVTFVRDLEQSLKAIGADNKIRVESFNFASVVHEGGYNPYRGLLARADHLMIVGQSQSMVSEALFVGKRVHVYDTHLTYGDFMKQNLLRHIRDFNCHAERKPFYSPPQRSYDATGETADRIIRAFDRLARLRTIALADMAKAPSPY